MDLNIKTERLFKILFNELADAKAQLIYQNGILAALGKHLSLPPELLSDVHRSKLLERHRSFVVQELSALLESQSEEVDDFFSSLLD
ncbi:MAG: hypothetical protein KKC03_06205 [Bacteroidetes bacterium]|nr:hypothetical protein [Bacteroidota bacterium]